MNPSITLDYLLSQSNGAKFHFNPEKCSLSLLLEAILRGLEIQAFHQFKEFSFGNGRNQSYLKEGYGPGYLYDSSIFGDGDGDGDGVTIDSQIILYQGNGEGQGYSIGSSFWGRFVLFFDCEHLS